MKGSLRFVVVALLVLMAMINATIRFDGDWFYWCLILSFQLIFSIYGGIYAYLYNKRMLSRFTSIDYIEGNEENKKIRGIGACVHLGIFLLLMFA
jgi:hypothetical protein